LDAQRARRDSEQFRSLRAHRGSVLGISPVGCAIINRLGDAIAASVEQAEATRAALQNARCGRSRVALFPPSLEMIETTRRRAFSPTNAIPIRQR
jgi:hypothetical protein